MTEHGSYRRSRNVLFRAYGNEVVLASPHDETFELLSGPAADAWALLSETPSEAQIVQALAEIYGVPEGTVAEGIGILFEDLRRRGFIEPEVHV